MKPSLFKTLAMVWRWQPICLAIVACLSPCLCSVLIVICLYMVNMSILVFHLPSGVGHQDLLFVQNYIISMYILILYLTSRDVSGYFSPQHAQFSTTLEYEEY